MAFLLSIETSTEVCSVALHDDGNLVITSEFHVEYSHASRLGVLIDQIMNAAEVMPNQLGAVAVSSGPGSYTGLRIGTSLAKGLCFSLDIPLISVGTLQLMAGQMRATNATDAIMCPMIDARRMEVYCLLMDSDFKIIHPTAAVVIDETSFASLLADRKIIFFGNGSGKCKDIINHENSIFVDNVFPRASFLGVMGFQRWREKHFENVEQFEPFYLKSFTAKKPKTLIG